MKIQKKKWGEGVGLRGGGGQGACVACERRIEVFGKIKKKISGGGGGVQAGCERRIEVFVKIQKKKIWGGGGGGVGSGGVWLGGGGGGSGWM